MSQDNSQNKVIVNILYLCIICASEYGTAGGVIHHIKHAHGYILIPRPTGHHRPADKHYEFESAIGNKWDVQHYGCPSCWYHTPKDPETILQHIMEVHKPYRIDGFTHNQEDEEDELYEEQSEQDNEEDNVTENNNEYNEDNEDKKYEKDVNVNESESILSSFLENEKDFIKEVYKILIEATTLFKKLAAGAAKD